jgi:GNAT superfamily N-acetyltransferase
MYKKVISRIKQYGLPTLIKRIVFKGFSKIGLETEVYLYCKRDLRLTKPTYQLPAGYTSCPLNLDLLQNRSAISFSPAKLEIFRNGLSSPDNCGVGILYNGKLVGFAWLSLTEIEVPFEMPEEVAMELTEEEGYLVDVFTDPDHRGQGFHNYYTIWCFESLEKLGRTTAITIIDQDNRAARRPQGRNGFRITTKYTVRQTIQP